MQSSGATPADDLVVSHFCRQIFNALGYPDKESAVLKKKWRVAVRVFALVSGLSPIHQVSAAFINEQATAVWYLRQFYMRNSLLDHDPRLTMLCSIFLAGKSEDSFVNIVDLQKIFNKFTEAQILKCEIVLLEGIEFNLKAFHPQNCLYSIIADIKRRDHDQTVVTQSLNEEQIQSRKKLVSSLVNAWLAVAEQCLAVIQSSALAASLNPLCMTLCVLKVTVSDELVQELDVQAYFEEKFGVQFLSSEAYVHLEEVREVLAAESSEETRRLREERLRDKMIELRKQNRWKRE